MESKEERKLDTIDRGLVQELIQFLVPFEAAINKLQGKLYPTLPYVLPLYFKLRDEICSVNGNDSSLMQSIKTKARRLLREIWGSEIRIEHKVAAFLSPSYKKLKGLSDDEISQVRLSQTTYCREIKINTLFLNLFRRFKYPISLYRSRPFFSTGAQCS